MNCNLKNLLFAYLIVYRNIQKWTSSTAILLEKKQRFPPPTARAQQGPLRLLHFPNVVSLLDVFFFSIRPVSTILLSLASHSALPLSYMLFSSLGNLPLLLSLPYLEQHYKSNNWEFLVQNYSKFIICAIHESKVHQRECLEALFRQLSI